MSMETIGRYEIIRELGRGGMATVYLARDPTVDRQVAVKVLPPQFTHDPQFRARFEREAKVVAGLEHACIVPVYDFGQQGDMPYIVMRYLPGGTLDARLVKGALSLKQALPILQRLAAALDTAHKRGVIHRDLKPGNILFDADGLAYLSDFGIAKITQDAVSFSGTGALIGTPEYMSPEQAMGQRALDARSDLYTLGVIAYQMLTGRHPYEAETPIGLMLKHVTEPAPVLDAVRYGLPADCPAVFTRALAKKPEERYASVVEFVQALTVQAARPPASAGPAPRAEPTPRAGTAARAEPVEARPPRAEPAARAEPAPRAEPVEAPLPAMSHPRHLLGELLCVNCGGAGLELQADGGVACRLCGAANHIQGEICLECDYVSPLNAEHCENCRVALVRYCPNCQTKNWSGLQTCVSCGQPLDALAYLSERWRFNTPEGQQQQLQNIRALKASEQEAADRRRAAMLEEEERRQQNLRAASARRARQERQVMLALGLGAIVMVVVMAIVAAMAMR